MVYPLNHLASPYGLFKAAGSVMVLADVAGMSLAVSKSFEFLGQTPALEKNPHTYPTEPCVLILNK